MNPGKPENARNAGEGGRAALPAFLPFGTEGFFSEMRPANKT